MSFFITKLTPVYNGRPGMTYVFVILAENPERAEKVTETGLIMCPRYILPSLEHGTNDLSAVGRTITF